MAALTFDEDIRVQDIKFADQPSAASALERLTQELKSENSLDIAMMLALKQGKVDLARRWLEMNAKIIAESDAIDSSWLCLRVALWRSTIPLLLEGIVGKFMGETSDTALNSAHGVSHALELKLGERVEAPVTDPWDAVAAKIREEIHQSEGTNDVFRPAGTQYQIRTTEARLQTNLPSEYTDFIRRSNGLGTPPKGWLPSLTPIEKIDWVEAYAEGYSDLAVEVENNLPYEYWKQLPKMTRILVISDDDEEWVLMIEPALVVEAEIALAKMRNDDQEAAAKKGRWLCVQTCVLLAVIND